MYVCASPGGGGGGRAGVVCRGGGRRRRAGGGLGACVHTWARCAWEDRRLGGAAPCSGGVCAQRRVALHPWVHGVVCCLGAGRTRHGAGARRACCPWDVGRVCVCVCVAPSRWDVDAAVSVVRAVWCGCVLPLAARCACGGVVVVARCCCSGAVCFWAAVLRLDTRPGSCVHARGRGPAHPPVLCPRQTLKSPLASGSMLR